LSIRWSNFVNLCAAGTWKKTETWRRRCWPKGCGWRPWEKSRMFETAPPERGPQSRPRRVLPRCSPPPSLLRLLLRFYTLCFRTTRIFEREIFTKQAFHCDKNLVIYFFTNIKTRADDVEKLFNCCRFDFVQIDFFRAAAGKNGSCNKKIKSAPRPFTHEMSNYLSEIMFIFLTQRSTDCFFTHYTTFSLSLEFQSARRCKREEFFYLSTICISRDCFLLNNNNYFDYLVLCMLLVANTYLCKQKHNFIKNIAWLNIILLHTYYT